MNIVIDNAMIKDFDLDISRYAQIIILHVLSDVGYLQTQSTFCHLLHNCQIINEVFCSLCDCHCKFNLLVYLVNSMYI